MGVVGGKVALRIAAKQQAGRAEIAAATALQRIRKIRRLHDALLRRRDEIRKALWDDYRKPAEEVELLELFSRFSGPLNLALGPHLSLIRV